MSSNGFVLIEIVLGLMIYLFGISLKQFLIFKDFEAKNIDFDRAIPLAWFYIPLFIVIMTIFKISLIPSLVSCSCISFIFLGGDVGRLSVLPPIKSFVRQYHIYKSLIIRQIYFDWNDFDSNWKIENMKKNFSILLELKNPEERIGAYVIIQGCYLSIYTTIFFCVGKFIFLNSYKDYFDFSISLVLQIAIGFLITIFFVHFNVMIATEILEIRVRYVDKISKQEIDQSKKSVREYLEKEKVPSFWQILIRFAILCGLSVIGIMAYMFRPTGIFEYLFK